MNLGINNSTNFNGKIFINKDKIAMTDMPNRQGVVLDTNNISEIRRYGDQTFIAYGKYDSSVILKENEYDNTLRAYTAANSNPDNKFCIEV